MAHNLSVSRITGRVEMFYSGAAPWHKLGQRVTEAQSSAEALRLAGLDWTVSKSPLYLKDGRPVADRVAVVRDDDQRILGTVGDGYRIVQNAEAFGILDDIAGVTVAGAAVGAQFHTAGALGAGERTWALVKLPASTVVVPDDVVNHYLLLANAHDGTMALTVRWTPIRVVCQNTLTAALSAGAGRPGVYVKHTLNARHRIQEAQRLLGVSQKYFAEAGTVYRALAHKDVSAMMLRGYLDAVFPLTVAADATAQQRADATERQRKVTDAVAYLFETGRGNQMPGVKGTLWAAFNAATEYVDHVRPLTADGKPRVGGYESAVFGAGMDVRQRAMREAVALL